jgi:hypothetical protein
VRAPPRLGERDDSYERERGKRGAGGRDDSDERERGEGGGGRDDPDPGREMTRIRAETSGRARDEGR